VLLPSTTPQCCCPPPTSQGHPCYNASKDLVVPAFKPPYAYGFSPYVMGKGDGKRDILAFFKGDMGQHREARYSRGIRQRVYNMSREQHWREKHRIIIGGYDDVKQEYGELLARSVFCLVMPGGLPSDARWAA
jgi:hypothetical protein